ILILALSVIGGLEARRFFLKKGIQLNFIKTIMVSAVLPIYMILVVMNILPSNYTIGILTLSICLLFLREALMRDAKLIETVLERLPAYCFLLVFPGLFMSYLIRINLLENSSLLIIIFLTFVFSNDTFAYLTGMLFGKNSRGIFAVSPKKSFAGLLGGLIAAGLAGFIFYIFYPFIFKNNLIFAVFIGVAIGITAVIGDLTESALKRSADEKDSGTIMAGRGGVLDSIDSILFSAPVFYYIMVLYQQ
ncbi:MAG: phosphatidate cytidylyltransferase, partial [Spirochaetales bacterium]|nr:phosphatidate cytidylyltransferase [Spirochaetales bacterium]